MNKYAMFKTDGELLDYCFSTTIYQAAGNLLGGGFRQPLSAGSGVLKSIDGKYLVVSVESLEYKRLKNLDINNK